MNKKFIIDLKANNSTENIGYHVEKKALDVFAVESSHGYVERPIEGIH